MKHHMLYAPIFLTFIEHRLNLPYAVAIPAAVNYRDHMLNDWESLSTNRFIVNNTPFPKCSALRGFLYEIHLWDPLGTSPGMEEFQTNFCTDYIDFIQNSGYVKWLRKHDEPKIIPKF